MSTVSDTVRDLGVILDGRLTMADHVAAVCRFCYYQLRQLRSVARSLSAEGGSKNRNPRNPPKFTKSSVTLSINRPIVSATCLNQCRHSSAADIIRPLHAVTMDCWWD